MRKKFATWLSMVLLLVLQLPALSPLAQATGGTNLITNPSVETPSSSPSIPQGWLEGNWGSNTATFSYLSTGEDGSHSVEVSLSNYSSGDAKWYFTPVAVQAGANYIFSDYYQSTVTSYIVAQYTDVSGNDTYDQLATVPASTTWQPESVNLTAPTGTTSLTIFHLISSNGSLTIDNASLTAAAAIVAPTVSISAPLANATVSGSTTLSANATDSTGITSVQFQVDGANVGTADTAAPYQTTWNTSGVSNGTHSVTAIATDTGGTKMTSSPVSVTVNNPVAPGSNLIANPSVETASGSSPTGWTNNAWGTNTTTFSYLSTGHTGMHSLEVQTTKYTSGDAKWYFNSVPVQAGSQYSFSDYYESNIASELDVAFTMSDGSTQYLYLGSPAASATWKQFSSNFSAPAGAQSATVFHLIAGVGQLTTDDFSLSASTVPTVTVNPVAATLTGTVQLSATASDNAGIKNVQFKIDGTNVGSPVTTSPYQLNWNSTTVANGTHSLTAVATDVNGKSTTSPAVSITVSNPVPVGGNMVPNPSVETVDPANSQAPQDWQSSSWGTNTTTFSYLNTGHTGTHSVSVQMTSYTDGDAKWFFTPQTVTADTQYQFSDYYQSNTATEVDAVFTMSDGSTVYQIIGLPGPSTAWSKFSTTFSVPLGAQNVTVYHLIHSVGTLTLDDANMQAYTPTGFSSPLVTLTFDDGYSNMYTQALPLLQKYGLHSTQFVITDDVNTTGYLTSAQVDDLYLAGNEIASHTVTHDDMTTETSAQIKTELQQSQTTLESWIGGAPVTDLAYPYGLYNSSVTTQTAQYYQGARGVEEGLNSKDNFNQYDIKVQNVFNTTTTAQVADWVAQAKATKTWLVLVYHSVDPDVNSTIDGGIYNITPTQLDAQLAAVKASAVPVVTMHQALADILPQL